MVVAKLNTNWSDLKKSNEKMVNVKKIYSNMLQQRVNIVLKCKEKKQKKNENRRRTL